jgi:hypothetical protein
MVDRDDLDAGATPEQLAAERAAAKEALRRLHQPAADGSGRCDWCGEPFPCPDSLRPGRPGPDRALRSERSTGSSSS